MEHGGRCGSLIVHAHTHTQQQLLHVCLHMHLRSKYTRCKQTFVHTHLQWGIQVELRCVLPRLIELPPLNDSTWRGYTWSLVLQYVPGEEGRGRGRGRGRRTPVIKLLNFSYNWRSKGKRENGGGQTEMG